MGNIHNQHVTYPIYLPKRRVEQHKDLKKSNNKCTKLIYVDIIILFRSLQEEDYNIRCRVISSLIQMIELSIDIEISNIKTRIC